MSSAIKAWGREDFEARLIGAAQSYPVEDTRFYQLLAAGRCPKAVLRRYALATARSADLFCSSIAWLIESAPDREARLILLENLLEEEGIVLKAGRGLVVRDEQRHPALARRFLRACGGEDASDSEIEQASQATSVGREMIAQRRWTDAVAFLLVGQEYKFSQVCKLLSQAFRRIGLGERDIAFFLVHIEADAEHGRQALELVLDRATTAAQQRSALAAANAGARHWFDMHGGSALKCQAA